MIHRSAGGFLLGAVSLIAAFGCGPRSARPTDVPTLSGDPVAPGSGAVTEAVPDAGAAPAPTTPGPPLPPPAEPVKGLSPQLVAAVGGRKLYVEQLDSLLLLGEERLQAQQLMADWATAAGLSVLPPGQTEEMFALAAAGKNPQTGAACGPALDRGLARERWLPALGAAGRIDATVSCSDGCVLQLAIELNGLGTEFFAAPFDPAQPVLQELARRLPTVVDNGGHDQRGHGNNPVPILGATPGPGAAEWLPGDATRLPLTAKAEAAIARSCGVTFAPVQVLLVPGAGGPRCEPLADSDSWREINPKVNACVCTAILKDHKIEARRHAQIDETQPSGPQSLETRNGLIASGEVVTTQGNDGKQMAWFLPGSSSLSHCLLGRTQERETTQLGATVDFDREGNAVKASIGDLDGLLKKDERECVLKVLRTARAPCPEQPASSGVGYVWVSVRKE